MGWDAHKLRSIHRESVDRSRIHSLAAQADFAIHDVTIIISTKSELQSAKYQMAVASDISEFFISHDPNWKSAEFVGNFIDNIEARVTSDS